MTYLIRPHSNLPKTRAWTVNRAAESQLAEKTSNIATRRVEIAWMGAEGQVENRSAVVPAMPIFLGAFSAIAQGALIQTSEGYVAVEDLVPGMMIATADGGNEPLQWVGSMTLFPNQAELGLPDAGLFRVTEGSFGLDRGAPDLLLGPSARVLPGVMAVDTSSRLIDVDDLADGMSVIPIRPLSAVRVFHLCLPSHRLIRANGVLIETYHPEDDAYLQVPTELYEHFMTLFPHLRNDGDFGPLNHLRSA